MAATAETEQFDRVVWKLREQFPGLRMRVFVDPHEYVQAAADIPPQEGLDFGLQFTLQGDELHLHVGGSFWVEWFPCGDEVVADEFFAAVAGIISGRYRVVEYILADAPVKAQLQRPIDGGRWEKVATWSSLGALIPWRRSQSIIQNTGAGPLTLSRGA